VASLLVYKEVRSEGELREDTLLYKPACKCLYRRRLGGKLYIVYGSRILEHLGAVRNGGAIEYSVLCGLLRPAAVTFWGDARYVPGGEEGP